MEKFLEGEGSPKIIVCYQIQDTNNNDDIKDTSAEPTLFFTYGESEKLKEKAIWFVRMLPDNRKSVNLNETSDNEVIWGEITP